MAKAKPASRHTNSLTILGSGTSAGVPFIGCNCRVCRSKDPKNKRTRASAWFQVNGKSIVIDTGPDFRQQALREKILKVDAVLYTHPHADHIHGIDDLRNYNYIQKQSIPVYGNDWVASELPSKFNYIFRPGPVEGGGIPLLNFHRLDTSAETTQIAGVSVTLLPHQHGSKESLGYRIDSVAYVADCSYIPPTTLDRLRGLSVLVLDCVRLEPHRTHLNLERALELVAEVKPKKAYLTHLNHEFDDKVWTRKLPKGVALAYDGLKIRF
jgi:phosphoribosyl 1,2-cyclic phosphate phosphodiesterase